jgi:hypothetical protein
MGFGSYDEGDEMDHSQNDDEDNGEDFTQKIKGKPRAGEESLEDESMIDMMKHL